MTINLTTANNFKSTKESRKALIEKLSYDERKMFVSFVRSVEGYKLENTILLGGGSV